MSIEQEIEKLLAESQKFEEAAPELQLSEEEQKALDEAKALEEAEAAEAAAKLAEETAKAEAEAKALEEEQAAAVKAAMADDVAALVEGEDLSEEFKVKAATIFEAAVLARVKSEVSKLEEKYTEAFDLQLEEAVSKEVEGLIEQVDGYLSYMAEQWMKDNEIALDRGLKTDILEGFVVGLKDLFVEHSIEVPEGADDVIAEMETIVTEKEALVEELTSKLNESEQRNIALNKTLSEKTRADLIEAKVAGMTDIDAAKFKDLAGELVFESAETFDKKLQVIRENYFDKKVTAPTDATFLQESTQTGDVKEVNPEMDAYIAALSLTK